MKKTLRAMVLGLAGAVSILSLTACGGGSGSKKADDGIIKIGVKADITSFDPQKHNDTISAYATRHIYSNLIDITSDNEFVGDLAESWEYLDDTNVKFKLKEGVKFQNGTPLTAEDVKFSLERQKDSPRVGHLVSMIDNVEVVDDTNFIIHMNAPSNALVSSLQHMGSAILCKSYTEELEASGKTLEEAPMGSGPYKFVEWVPGASFKLEKYEEYFDPARKAQNNGLLFKVIPEESSRTIALENGEIDLLTHVGSNDAEKIRSNSKLKLDEFPSTKLEYFAMNVEKAPFDNVKVRQAMNYAINKEDVVTAAINKEGKSAQSYIGDAAIGYYDTAVNYEYNVEKAKELLKEAGLEKGFTFTTYAATDVRSRSATVIQANLAALGITMNIEQMESSTFYEKTGKGEHDACMAGWVANAEPDNTYRPLFTSSKAGPGGNRTFYKNPEVDTLVDDASTNRDKAKVEQDYKDILKIVSEDAIWCPLYMEKGTVARNADLQGLGNSSMELHNFYGLHY